MRIALPLIIVIHLAIILSQALNNPIHLADSTWPDHAKVHVVESMFWIIGFNLAACVVALVPFQKGERWAWWLLLFTAVAIIGTFLVVNLSTEAGPPAIAIKLFTVLGLLYALALGLSWKDMK